MKTAEEIKKGLECCYAMDCACLKRGCPYTGMRLCHDHVLKDARDYILKLEEENEKLQRYYEAEADRAADSHHNMLEAEASVPRWIPVEERLPEKNSKVLVLWVGHAFEAESIGDGYVEPLGDRWILAGRDFTHWMPLPELPEVTKP